MYYEKLKCIIKVFAIIILIVITSIFVVNQYIFMTRDIRELAPFQLGENDIVESETKNTIVIKCTLCQGHYDFSFSDFYFIFICCVEASK